MDEKIARINELYHKSKTEGLTEEEKEEQKTLRADYVRSFRENLRATLDNVSILEPDGTVTNPKKNLKN
ncbi:MAG: DUF896 domain-containing protein [Lachnospiraceae bacterium]|nr:DUF896 domain-containing protein [Lachnospiraceae bacterium]MBQ8548827.1 DUF896 domain-containing protein [Lachnospiraceae bacterium]MBQ8847042.1 DUF896 domain-containing protein [Lachnospiraceae bacterium]